MIKSILTAAIIVAGLITLVACNSKNRLTKNQETMFTVEQIKAAHAKVKSGADFPTYIQEIKVLGVMGFETWVKDSHTEYFGDHGYRTKSTPMYDLLPVSEKVDIEKFNQCLKIHQEGKTDYYTFCKDCAGTGVEKWVVNLDAMTCIYFDKAGNELLVEEIPQN